MKRLILPLLVVGLSLTVAWAQPVEQPDTEPFPLEEERPFNFWMDVKLKKSQDIFAALTEADFERIAASAQQLRSLSEFEGLVRKGIPGYLTQMSTFRFAIKEIESQAKAHNIEGVTLGFQQLTLSCVHCHKVLRAEITESHPD